MQRLPSAAESECEEASSRAATECDGVAVCAQLRGSAPLLEKGVKLAMKMGSAKRPMTLAEVLMMSNGVAFIFP
ncbi:hypothetical protein KR51_00001120 [Rubidibacter lacunae KORDI 51-2]|uniref:Uncharacterized protein n=1 Tax=Rubidibacter lacunae KORDI 51-2 TaxID=582515 RepID=U5DU47_9CHRO|nr:hypothetical protein KR51_00001120 [Rubidibacter lacunae KORDI 51-2]